MLSFGREQLLKCSINPKKKMCGTPHKKLAKNINYEKIITVAVLLISSMFYAQSNGVTGKWKTR
jgi:hypothetical protein